MWHRTLRVFPADGRGTGQRGTGPVRAHVLRVRWTFSARNGWRHAERAGSALFPLVVRCARRDPAPDRARRERASHGRGVLQGRRTRAAHGAASRWYRFAKHQGTVVMTSVVLLDSGGSNIGSLRFALQRLGVDA